MIKKGTKDDLVVGSRRASEVVVVGIGNRTHLLEEDGVGGGFAVARPIPDARVVAASRSLQLSWAPRRYVGFAARPLATPRPSLCWHRQKIHGHVEAVDEGDIEEIVRLASASRELG